MFEDAPVLRQSKWLRFATLCLLYVSQGLPIGLFQVALPAWFASQGLSLAEVGEFIAIVFLPWTFKLFAAPIMDRFAFPAMGRRRPWVLLAQSGLVLSLLLLAILAPDPKENFNLLAALGFLANFFGAVQDVAVDGMAIDILEEDERAQANAYMFGGQVAGMGVAGAAGSAVLLTSGLAGAGLLMAASVTLIMLFPLCLRERQGERLLPWSSGEASKQALGSVNESWRDILVSLFRALILPMSLILILVEGLQRISSGMLVAIWPVLTVQDLDWVQTQYTNWASLVGICAAVFGVLLGAQVDRVGALKVLIAAIVFRALLFLVLASLPAYWASETFLKSILLIAGISQQFVTITIIALFMRLCLKSISATQFAVYMASANLTLAMGSWIIAPLSEFLDFQQMFYAIAGLHLLFLLIIPFFNIEKHEVDKLKLGEQLEKGEHASA